LTRANDTATEGDDPPLCIVDRKYQSVAKAGTRLTSLLLHDEQPCFDLTRVVVAQRLQMLSQERRLTRCESQPKPVGNVAIELTFGQVVTRRRAKIVGPQRLGEEFGRSA